MEVKESNKINIFSSKDEAKIKYEENIKSLSLLDGMKISLLGEFKLKKYNYDTDNEKFIVLKQYINNDILDFAKIDNSYKEQIKQIKIKINDINAEIIERQQYMDISLSQISETNPEIRKAYVMEIESRIGTIINSLKQDVKKYLENIEIIEKQIKINENNYQEYQKKVIENEKDHKQKNENFEKYKYQVESELLSISEKYEKISNEQKQILQYINSPEEMPKKNIIPIPYDPDQKEIIKDNDKKELIDSQNISYTEKINKTLSGEGKSLPEYENKISIDKLPIKAINYDLNGVGYYVPQVRQLLESEFVLDDVEMIYKSKNDIIENNGFPWIEIIKNIIIWGGTIIINFALLKFAYNTYYHSEEIEKKEDKINDAKIDMQIIDKNAEIQKLQIKKDIN